MDLWTFIWISVCLDHCVVHFICLSLFLPFFVDLFMLKKKTQQQHRTEKISSCSSEINLIKSGCHQFTIKVKELLKLQRGSCEGQLWSAICFLQVWLWSKCQCLQVDVIKKVKLLYSKRCHPVGLNDMAAFSQSATSLRRSKRRWANHLSSKHPSSAGASL